MVAVEDSVADDTAVEGSSVDDSVGSSCRVGFVIAFQGMLEIQLVRLAIEKDMAEPILSTSTSQRSGVTHQLEEKEMMWQRLEKHSCV